MLHFDLYTLCIATLVNLLLTSFAMLMFWSVNRGLVGIRDYCAANFLTCGGFLLLVASAFAPGRHIVLLAHLMLFAGGILLLESLRTFRLLRRIPIYVTVPAAGVYIALIAYWLFARDDVNARAAISSPVFALISICSAVSMAVRVPARQRTVYWSTAAFFSLHALSLTVRAGQAFNGTLATDVFALKTLDLLSLVTLNLTVTGCAFGLSTALSLRCRDDAEVLARHDPLTLLPNRRFFEERLEQAFRKAVRSGRGIALIYCDLDRFKAVNDALGHMSGDEVLRLIALRLQAAVQAGACLARIGGDEFLLLLEGVDSRDEAIRAMAGLKHAMQDEFAVSGHRLVLDISCGHALFPDDVETAEELISHADAAMYRMKRSSERSAPVYT